MLDVLPPLSQVEKKKNILQRNKSFPTFMDISIKGVHILSHSTAPHIDIKCCPVQGSVLLDAQWPWVMLKAEDMSSCLMFSILLITGILHTFCQK